jgi:hypothetical protein
LLLYWFCAAPGLTWAHHGADGGDLLAAALTNGVPHPTGYPLYTLLLRGWLWLGEQLNPQLEAAYWGNRLNALCMAGVVAFTAAGAQTLLAERRGRALWAGLSAAIFAITPLAWSQATITEVYALHALLVAAMGWVALRPPLPHRDILLGLLMGLGLAHHLTSLLLWPTLLVGQLYTQPRHAWLGTLTRTVGIALLVATLFYVSLVWRTLEMGAPALVSWGYPRDPAGLWWLVSGAAYRSYLFSMTPLEYGGRLLSLMRLLVDQLSPFGFALVIGGLAVWDRQRPALRNGALLWLLPISLYAAGYNTPDSYIYLLPVVWLMSLMIGQALASGSAWLVEHVGVRPSFILGGVATLTMVGIALLALVRLPDHNLRQDREAQEFLADAATTLEAGSLVITLDDAPTFALWYGVTDKRLTQSVPDLIIVNYALYQFGWYRDLMHDHYGSVPMMGAPFAEMLAANQSLRPIFLTEPLPDLPAAELTQVGNFWRLK